MSIIYVLTNPAMPGLVKIGKTRNLKHRLKSLDNTSVPYPFRCEFALRVRDSGRHEELLHDAFEQHRVRKRREFFELGVSHVIAAMKLTGGKDVTPKDDIGEDETGVEAANKVIKKTGVFNFEKVGIPPGSVLTFHDSDETTSTVHDHNKIQFEGEVTSLSAAALVLLHRAGRNWSSAAGPVYWLFEGETLYDRRLRMEREAAEADED